MPVNADEYEAICNARECLVKVNEDFISTPYGSIKSSRMTSWPMVLDTQPRMLGFLGEKEMYTFNLNGYDQYGKKKSLNIHFLNDKPAKKFIREIEMVSGLGLGQRRSAKQIRENELLDKKTITTTNIKVENSKVNECFSEVGASRKSKIALERFREKRNLENFFKNSNAYAVFPDVVKGGMGVGGARGGGEVFQNCKAIGSTTMTQFSVGFQLGGQAFSQIIFFQNQRDTDRFTQGNFEFGASASAALITEGAATEAAYSDGVGVLTISKGGLMYEASIGGQKFSFEPYKK